MYIAEDRATLRKILQQHAHDFVGLVPTMGALHQGHLSLVSKSLSDGNFTVCSIYVNPAQFNRPEDLQNYPRSVQEDLHLLEQSGCHAVFLPSDREMYPLPPSLTFNFGRLEQVLEGTSRPGHFNGVAVVVSKLFHMIAPQKAYFGLKDYQQVLIVKQLIESLSFGIELVACSTEREADGLAMSSRNKRLTSEQRIVAPQLYRMLEYARDRFKEGRMVQEVKSDVTEQLKKYPEVQLDYFELADGTTLEFLNDTKESSTPVLFIAAQLGSVRLIDNLPLFSYF